jgi:hypothetical protein
VTVNRLPSSLRAGVYHLVAEVVDADGTVSFATTVSTVTAADPIVTVSGAGLSVHPSTLTRSGQAFTYTLALADTGNVDAVGTATVASSLFNATTAIGTIPPDSFSFKAHLKVGRTQKFTIHGKYAGGVPSGTYTVQLAVSLDGGATTFDLPGALTVA